MTISFFAKLSAEPLVGLKPCVGTGSGSKRPLSAEPLVGLKRPCMGGQHGKNELSAEPLVGLKPIVFILDGGHFNSFSRTPRGFEAVDVSHCRLS